MLYVVDRSIWGRVFFLVCLLARGSLKLLLVVSYRPLARGGFPGAEPRKPPACLVSYSPLTSPRSPSSTRARTSEESGRRPRRLLNRSPRPPRRGTAAPPRPCSPPGSWERPTRRGPARSCPKRGRSALENQRVFQGRCMGLKRESTKRSRARLSHKARLTS